jgi:hypothetical protein
MTHTSRVQLAMLAEGTSPFTPVEGIQGLKLELRRIFSNSRKKYSRWLSCFLLRGIYTHQYMASCEYR